MTLLLITVRLNIQMLVPEVLWPNRGMVFFFIEQQRELGTQYRRYVRSEQ